MAAFEDVWRQSRVVLVEPGRDDLTAILGSVDLARDLVLVGRARGTRRRRRPHGVRRAGPGIGSGLARSATTRRDGYVTLPDIGVTVLDALGVAVPDAMNGTASPPTAVPPTTPARATALADANTIAVFRDRTVGPVSVAFVVLQVVIYARRHGAARHAPAPAAPWPRRRPPWWSWPFPP